MLSELLKDENFKDMLTEHTEDITHFLIEHSVDFGILCNLSEITFNPELPETIGKTLKPLTLFILSGYTLESAHVDSEEEMLYFEAGFGEENFGSVVGVPIDAIIQIAIEDTVIHINLAASIQRPKKEKKVKSKASEENSMNAFLSNPENDKFKK